MLHFITHLHISAQIKRQWHAMGLQRHSSTGHDAAKPVAALAPMVSHEILGYVFIQEVQTLPGSPSMGSPFTNHWIEGLGFPLARHTNLPSSPGAKMRFCGSSSQYGAALRHTNGTVTHRANWSRWPPEDPKLPSQFLAVKVKEMVK